MNTPVHARSRATAANHRNHGWPAVVGVLLVAATLAGCSTSSPDVVSRNEAQRLATISDAVVLSTRPVVVDGSQSGIGATAGGVVGGIAGASVGGRREAAAVGVIGAVVGGVIGNVTERMATREEAVEIIVQLKNGDRRSIVQAKASESFEPGDPVLLVASQGKVRVMKAPPVATQASAPATQTPDQTAVQPAAR
jgi:outer membrane lipoprotein SlyB